MTTYKTGDIVRFKGNGNMREFKLDDVNPNPTWKEDDEYFATGWDSHGSVEVDDPEDIELVLDAKAASARKLPTADEIARDLNLLGGFSDVVDIDETEQEGDGRVACSGRAANGLRVGFVVRVVEVQEVD